MQKQVEEKGHMKLKKYFICAWFVVLRIFLIKETKVRSSRLISVFVEVV